MSQLLSALVGAWPL